VGFYSFVFAIAEIKKGLHRVFPNFDLPIITARDDFAGISVEKDIVDGSFMPNELEGSDLRFEIPHFDDTISASGYDLFP
jgi:hypothetical protein